MTVYVDDMWRYPMGEYRGMRMSHMVADTEQELHEMADAIGVARKWYQGDHYDVSMTKRDEAIRRGAVPIPLRILARMCVHRRKTGILPSPDDMVPLNVKLAVQGRVVIRRSKT